MQNCNPTKPNWCEPQTFNLTEYIKLIYEEGLRILPQGVYINKQVQIRQPIFNNVTFLKPFIKRCGAFLQIILPDNYVTQPNPSASPVSDNSITFRYYPVIKFNKRNPLLVNGGGVK